MWLLLPVQACPFKLYLKSRPLTICSCDIAGKSISLVVAQQDCLASSHCLCVPASSPALVQESLLTIQHPWQCLWLQAVPMVTRVQNQSVGPWQKVWVMCFVIVKEKKKFPFYSLILQLTCSFLWGVSVTKIYKSAKMFYLLNAEIPWSCSLKCSQPCWVEINSLTQPRHEGNSDLNWVFYIQN